MITDITKPRLITNGVYWLGGCLSAFGHDEEVHYHVSAYLVVGKERTALVDTGDPAHGDVLIEQLAQVLGERSLDYIVPTHPEIPHAGNIPSILARYPEARIVGEIRDYHLHFPEFESQLIKKDAYETLDLGGRTLRFIPAFIRDLDNTTWVYDDVGQCLFVSDGFSYIHDIPSPDPEEDEPVHRPGQCRLFSGEMPEPPTVEQAAYGTGRALYWTKFVDVREAFLDIEMLLEQFPVQFIGPAHGNVIDQVDEMLLTSLAAHRAVYEGPLP